MTLLTLNTIGLSVLTETLHHAAGFIYLKSTAGKSETAHCYAFIQGTSLNIFMAQYGLDYDADRIRQGFNYYLQRKKNDCAR